MFTTDKICRAKIDIEPGRSEHVDKEQNCNFRSSVSMFESESLVVYIN